MSELRKEILPVIFSKIPDVVSRFKVKFDRSGVKEFQALLKPDLTRKKYTKYAPVLFPGPTHQENMARLFMSDELALVHLFFFGNNFN